jgi:hypothetical protein
MGAEIGLRLRTLEKRALRRIYGSNKKKITVGWRKLHDILLSFMTYYYYLFTPWCRIFFERLIATQLVKGEPVFFMENPSLQGPA